MGNKKNRKNKEIKRHEQDKELSETEKKKIDRRGEKNQYRIRKKLEVGIKKELLKKKKVDEETQYKNE